MWTCPACQSTVEDQFEVCWSCGTSRTGEADPDFVRADDLGPIPDAEPRPVDPKLAGHDGALAIAYRALDLQEAQFLADQLTEAGLPARADEQDMHETLGGMTSGPRVYVHESDLAGARAWLADYDRNKSVVIEHDEGLGLGDALGAFPDLGP